MAGYAPFCMITASGGQKILLANDTNNGIEHRSDFRSGSLQVNTSALGQLGKPLDLLRGNGLLCEIIPYCTPYFIRQQYQFCCHRFPLGSSFVPIWTSNGKAMRVFLVIFGQGILSPLNELIQVRSGLINCQWLLSQGMLKTGKYLLIPYFMGITCG
jgi:hypothetical protein